MRWSLTIISAVQIVDEEIAEYHLAHASHTFMQQSKTHVWWKAPTTRMVKVYWESVVCLRTQKMGIGIVILDSNKEVLSCLSSSRAFCSQPIIANVEPIMDFCFELLEVPLEGDA